MAENDCLEKCDECYYPDIADHCDRWCVLWKTKKGKKGGIFQEMLTLERKGKERSDEKRK